MNTKTIVTLIIVLMLSALTDGVLARNGMHSRYMIVSTETGPSGLLGYVRHANGNWRNAIGIAEQNDYYYPDMKAAHFTHDWTWNWETRNGHPTHPEALARNAIQAYISPGNISVHSPNDFSAYLGWHAETSTSNPLQINHQDLFGRPLWDGEIDGEAMLGNSGTIGNGGDEGDVFVGDHNPGGYIIGNPNAQDNVLTNNWASIRPYFAFWSGGGGGVTIWLRVRKITTTVPANQPLLTFTVRKSPQEPNGVTTVFNAGDVPTGFGWISATIPVGYWLGNDGDPLNHVVKFALKWHGGDVVQVSKMKWADNRWLKLDPNAGDQDYKNAFIETFSSIQNEYEDNMSAFIAGETWRYQYTSFNNLTDMITENFRTIRNLEDGRDPHIDPVNVPRFTCFAPGYGDNEIGNFLDQAEPGILFWDSYPISWSTTESSTGANNIQLSWNGMISGVDAAYPEQQEIHPGSLRVMKQITESRGVDLIAGVQSSGEKGSWYGDPSPRMVKCMAWLDLTFLPKGLFYHYYAPIFHLDANSDPMYTPLQQGAIQENFNGALCSGLVSLCPDKNAPNNLRIENQNELDAALDNRGWLRPNDKWFAAQEVNGIIEAAADNMARWKYVDSQCLAELPANQQKLSIRQNGTTIHIEDVSNGGQSDNVASRFVQLAVFDGQQGDDGYDGFMLVNRRCQANETRVISVWVDFPPLDSYNGNQVNHKVVDEGNEQRHNNDALKASGPNDLLFTITLAPASGMVLGISPDNNLTGPIDVDRILQGYYRIDSEVIVNPNVKLTILPNTTLAFGEYGGLTVNGSIAVRGRNGTSTELTTRFISQLDTPTAILKINGSLADTLSYCSIEGLSIGLEANLSSTENLYIDNCSINHCANEGLKVTGGNVTVNGSTFKENGSDGIYLYNCKALFNSDTIIANAKNGIYCYSTNSATHIQYCKIERNGESNFTSPYSGIRFFGCSPKVTKCNIYDNVGYGLNGLNGSYPMLYNGSTSADNTIGGNASHETYWNASYPSISYGHNNFDVADDTIIYITNSSLTTFYAQNNYWGGGAPNTGTGSRSYYGPGVFSYSPYDAIESLMLPGDVDITQQKGGGAGFGNRISEAEEEAQTAFASAIEAEVERLTDAIQGYRGIIERFGETSVAPIAVERLLWAIRNSIADENQRNTELDRLSRFYSTLSDTSSNHDLAWKARRASLWALAAQHRYEEAIRGFEAIVENHEDLADSIFAVIDAGTLQLEAREWAARDSGAHVQSLFGTRQELAPANFEAHRKHTDELLGLLGVNGSSARPTVPSEFFLDQNFPNPFNAVTQIRYGLPEASDVKLCIYDLMGREVITLINGKQKAGFYKMAWDGRNADGMQVTSGMYFVRIETPNFTKVNKMTLVK